MPLRDFLSITWNHIQANLFPWLAEELGPLTDTHKQVITTLPEFHQQVHLMYFNNLDAPLPSALRNSFEDLFNAFAVSQPGYEVRLFSWLFSPLSTAVLTSPELHWWAFWVWQSPDMNFELKMADYAQRQLPFTSQEHLPDLLLRLSDPAAWSATDPARHLHAKLPDHGRRPAHLPGDVEQPDRRRREQVRAMGGRGGLPDLHPVLRRASLHRHRGRGPAVVGG